jgi:hypothetical protein
VIGKKPAFRALFNSDQTLPVRFFRIKVRNFEAFRKENMPMFWNIRFLILLLFVTFSLGCSREAQQTEPVKTTTEEGSSTAPPAKQAAESDKALVRVVNANPNVPDVDVFADEAKAFAGVGFKEATPYKELPDDRLTFRLRSAGKETANPLAENTELLNGGRHYTVVAMPDENGKSAVRVLSDDLTPAPSNKARVRIINAAPDAGEIDLVAKDRDQAIFDNVNFMSEAGYKEVQPMTGTLEIRREGKKKALATIPQQNWEAGKTYTIILTGRGAARGNIEAIAIEDQLGASTASSRQY